MVLVDMPMPDRCGNCIVMRCSRCLITSKNIMDHQANKTKPEWCPIKGEVKSDGKG